MIVYQCQVCGYPCGQHTDDSGFPERPRPCPQCEARARLAAGDLPHLNEARRLYLALNYVTSALEYVSSDHCAPAWRHEKPHMARRYDRMVSRAWALMDELGHLKIDPDERRRHGDEAETDEAPAPSDDLGQGGEHGQETRRLRGEPG